MYFGELSYNYNNDLNEYVQIMRTTYKYNEDISIELKDLLDKMIEINPIQRADIDECLEHNWMRKKDTTIIKESVDSLQKERIQRTKSSEIKKVE